jgi:hypothetical protein
MWFVGSWLLWFVVAVWYVVCVDVLLMYAYTITVQTPNTKHPLTLTLKDQQRMRGAECPAPFIGLVSAEVARCTPTVATVAERT